MSIESSRKLILQGWEIGFQKVEFTNLLQQELGLRLSEAKDVTDRVLDGDRIELIINSEKYDVVAKRASELGAIVLEDVGVACQ